MQASLPVFPTIRWRVLSLFVGALLLVAHRPLTSYANWLSVAMWVNMGWALLNILPVIPWTRGRFLADRLGKAPPTTALLICAATVTATSTLGVLTIRHAGAAILFLTASLLSLFELAKANEQIRTRVIDARLGLARQLILDERYDEAMRASELILLQPRDFETRNAALTSMAWACLGQGQPRAAMAALAKVLPAQAVDPYTLAAVQRAQGERDAAIQTLERARTGTSFGREAARLLIDLYAELGDLGRAFAATLAHLAVLGAEDARLVVHALEQAGDFSNATTLSLAIGPTAAPVS